MSPRGGPPAPVHVALPWTGEHSASQRCPCGPVAGTNLATGGTAFLHWRPGEREAASRARRQAAARARWANPEYRAHQAEAQHRPALTGRPAKPAVRPGAADPAEMGAGAGGTADEAPGPFTASGRMGQ